MLTRGTRARWMHGPGASPHVVVMHAVAEVKDSRVTGRQVATAVPPRALLLTVCYVLRTLRPRDMRFSTFA